MALSFTGATFDKDPDATETSSSTGGTGAIRVTLNGESGGPNDDGDEWDYSYYPDGFQITMFVRTNDTSNVPDYHPTGFETQMVGTTHWDFSSSYDASTWDPYDDYGNVNFSAEAYGGLIQFNLSYMLLPYEDEYGPGEGEYGDGEFIKRVYWMKPDGQGGSDEVAYDIGDSSSENPGWSSSNDNYWPSIIQGDGSSSYWDIDQNNSYIYVSGYSMNNLEFYETTIYATDWNIENFEPDLDNWTGGTGDPHIKPFFGGPYNL